MLIFISIFNTGLTFVTWSSAALLRPVSLLTLAQLLRCGLAEAQMRFYTKQHQHHNRRD
jgi:hypothetical protein